MLFIFIVGITYLASLAVDDTLPADAHGLPRGDRGDWSWVPRGMGTMGLHDVSSGRLIGRIDIRLLLMDRPAADRMGDVRHDRLDAERLGKKRSRLPASSKERALDFCSCR